ncbi:hypothetical protein LTR09_000683 [Extremus antarcticus]|uniref:Transmembrane protein n=1 Tax=Extremus antarcticus TaxID=702011 RepID=A0AAJ0GK32_9PEZI|nr:hypothetical protein LTR09_000683 [Extremus antarcticus]
MLTLPSILAFCILVTLVVGDPSSTVLITATEIVLTSTLTASSGYSLSTVTLDVNNSRTITVTEPTKTRQSGPPSETSNIPYLFGQTVGDFLECYALPYGLVGFINHVCTYYTFVHLTLGRSAIWRPLKHWKRDLFYGVVALLGALPSIITTVTSCDFHIIFLFLALWKLGLSFLLVITTTGEAWKVRKRQLGSGGRQQRQNEGAGYKVSSARAGFSLIATYRVWEETPTLRKLSYGAAGGFGGLAIIGAYSAARWCRPWVRSKTEAVLVAIAVILGVGAVIYSDWALAVLTHNIIGRPKSDKRYIVVLYWMYFAAKRLPMLSS